MRLPSRILPRISAGSSASRKARTSARNDSSSGVYFRSTQNLPWFLYGIRRRRLQGFRRQPIDRRRQLTNELSTSVPAETHVAVRLEPYSFECLAFMTGFSEFP